MAGVDHRQRPSTPTHLTPERAADPHLVKNRVMAPERTDLNIDVAIFLRRASRSHSRDTGRCEVLLVLGQQRHSFKRTMYVLLLYHHVRCTCQGGESHSGR